MQHDPTLTQDLMERVCELDNLRRAYRQVVSNRGSAGIDRMTVEKLKQLIIGWIGYFRFASMRGTLRDLDQ
jgi:hypothetical protein